MHCFSFVGNPKRQRACAPEAESTSSVSVTTCVRLSTSRNAIFSKISAHSGERDQPYRLKVITDSGDCDHADHERLRPGVMVTATGGVSHPVREIAKQIYPSTSSRADATGCRR
jgi:hypothetical protein